MTRYICQKCGHESGYHEISRSKECESYGKCRIIDCDCECFVWDSEQLKKVNEAIKQKN